MSSVDLHTHTTASDGTSPPDHLVLEAREQGICVLAITDHDTVAGIAPALLESRRVELTLVPGVELSSEIAGHDVHILGYFVDHLDASFLTTLADLARRRIDRIALMVERLHRLGFSIDLDRVQALAAGSIGRPHIARAMIERGYAVDISDAFERYLGTGKPAYIPRYYVEPEACIRLIISAGGVPALAHPLSTGDVPGALRRLVPVGLRGLEVYYGEYDTTTHLELRRVADEWTLIPTGGSDYHGPNFKHARALGGAPVPDESYERLAEAARDGLTSRS